MALADATIRVGEIESRVKNLGCPVGAAFMTGCTIDSQGNSPAISAGATFRIGRATEPMGEDAGADVSIGAAAEPLDEGDSFFGTLGGLGFPFGRTSLRLGGFGLNSPSVMRRYAFGGSGFGATDGHEEYGAADDMLTL